MRDEFDDPTANGQFAKRPRVNEDQPPSKVLHVRSLPPDTTEAELTQLALPFGRVSGILMLSNKGQAFVQMEDVSQAVALVQYYSTVHAYVRGSVVFFQFSNRAELSTGSSSGNTRNVLFPFPLLFLSFFSCSFLFSLLTSCQSFHRKNKTVFSLSPFRT